MSTIVDKIRREPVLATALVQALLLLLVSFGVDLTDAQTAGVLAVTGAVLALVARSRVTPDAE